MSRFWLVSSFIEMVLWTILVPYLVWQQWSGWLAIGLLCWWALGYWRITIKGFISFMKQKAAFNKIATQVEAAEQDPFARFSEN